MSSSGFTTTTFQLARYLLKHKKRFKFAPKPLLLIYLVVASYFIFLQLLQ